MDAKGYEDHFEEVNKLVENLEKSDAKTTTITLEFETKVLESLIWIYKEIGPEVLRKPESFYIFCTVLTSLGADTLIQRKAKNNFLDLLKEMSGGFGDLSVRDNGPRRPF
jgi:hypothetical protein